MPGAGARRPQLEGPFRPDDTVNWPVVPLQDFSNVERQQRGLHSDSFERLRLSNVYEVTISNFHEEIDRVLAAHGG